MNNKNKVIKALLNVDLAITIVALISLILITFFGVIMRYAFSSPFIWLEEVQLWCFVWIVFFGGSVAFRTQNHVSIDMIVDSLPNKIRKVVEFIGKIIIIGILLFILSKSLVFVKQMIKIDRTTNILRIPYYLIYSAVPISLALMILNFIKANGKSKNEVKNG